MKTIKLFAGCFPVKGKTRSVICDVQRTALFYIPNALYELLTEYKDKTLDEIKARFEAEHHEQIQAYYDYLLANELAFETTEPENFPPIEMRWESFNTINNAIIDVDRNSNHKFKSIFNQLEQLHCDFVEIRCFDVMPIAYFLKIGALSARSRFRNISLFVKYHDDLQIEAFENMLLTYQRIGRVVVHSAPDVLVKQYNCTNSRIVVIADKIKDSSCCGLVDEAFFMVNLSVFSESHFYNNCLNKKIGIDKNGAIKNCPSMAQSFGNVKTTSLAEVVDKASFKKKWYINKDQVTGCKDCEFRYICMDCRAYVEDPEDERSKPLKCGYNPDTGKWSNWSKNPLKQRAKGYYQLQNVVVEKQEV